MIVAQRASSGASPARHTSLDAEELERFFELSARVFCDYRDPRRGRFKLLYVYSETLDNEESCFLRAVELAQASMMESLGIAEGDRSHGYEGFGHSVERLKAFGWKGNIPIVKFDIDGNVNTLSEAEHLADFGLAHKGDIGIVVPPFHLVRAFVTTVTALMHSRNKMNRTDDLTRVYAVPGVALSWMQQAVHSQGVLKNTRVGLLGSELERLEKYRVSKFGGMLSAKEVIDYLNWRDA